MMDYKIIPFEQKYRDDMLFAYLLAKDVLGSSPKIRDDLLDIQANYFDKNDMFWIAVSLENRVIGMIGTNTVSSTDLWLKRLFVKPDIKRKGLGGALLTVAENYAKGKGIKCLHTCFNDNYLEATQFYFAKGFIETERSDGLRHLVKEL